MRHRMCAGLLAAALVWVAGCANRTVTPGLTRDQERAIRACLAKDCGTGDAADRMAITCFQQAGRSAYAVLWAALRHGPTAQERSDVQDAATDAFARVDQYLSEGGLAHVTQVDIHNAALALDESTYVAMQTNDYVIAYQERALNAVIALHPPGTHDSLLSIADEPTLPPEVRTRILDAL